MKIITVAGARPNFIKIAPLIKEMEKYKEIYNILVHTGQHYNKNMSDLFFEDLEIREPDYNLGVGSGTHAEQTAKIMIEFEKVCLKEKPDLVIVFGDVNSTIACALVASKMNIKVAHVEAGLRSFDRTMPEEINRILTDRISDYLFVSERSGLENLKKEGIENNKVFFVGNIMIDSLIKNLPKIKKSEIMEKLNLKKKGFIIITLHRPSNVDDASTLKKLLLCFGKIQEKIKIVWPIHPRTLNNIRKFGFQSIFDSMKNLIITEPLGYIDFMKLVKESKLVLTDSGGIQEETTYLGIPCITLRDNTERPSTITEGTNILVGNNINKIFKETLKKINNNNKKKWCVPKFWDGNTAKRITKIIIKRCLK